MALKVAVIGASGIGKNHARWFHGHGCEVVAFVGSSPASVARTSEILRAGFPFTGRGYADVEEMLRQEKPDAVCVSPPPELHFAQVIQCLDAGAHVLCEKPLVGDESRTADELTAQARQLVEYAAKRGLLLGTQMQYAVAAATILELAGVAPDTPLRQWTMEMETKNVRPGRGEEKIWLDLSPHPLSVLQKMGPSPRIYAETIGCTVRAQETAARFQISFLATLNDDERCEARIIVRVNPERATPLRRFTINGRSVDVTARKNAAGDFRAFLTSDDGREIEMPDFVDALIGNFAAACQGREPLLVTGEDGAQNVAWQLQILQAANTKNQQG
jgi:hypothetical protein